MTNRIAVVLVVLLVIAVGVAWQVGVQARGYPPVKPQSQMDPERVKWVADSLKQMLTIKPGMTRSDLTTVFTTEGGLSHVTQRQYVYKGCPYFKVDVKFRPAHPKRDKDGRLTSRDSLDDVILSVSRPYLQYTIAD